MPETHPPISLERLRHVVLDLDGTIYVDEQLFPETKPFLAALAEWGIGYTFITNNNSRSRAEYLGFMRGLGLQVTEKSLFTSAHATLDYLRQHLPEVKRPFVLGTPGLRNDFMIAGYEASNGQPDAVVVGFDRTLTYDQLAKAAYWISRGLPYLATHPDRICPTKEATVLPDCGALCAALESATGRRPDAIPGKPSPAMMHGLLRRHGLQPGEVAMVGDRLYTDMKMARNAGLLAVLTLTGETKREEVAGSEVQPDLVVDNLGRFAELIATARPSSH